MEEKNNPLYESWACQEEGRASFANESTTQGLTNSAIQNSNIDHSRLTYENNKYPTFGTPGQQNVSNNTNPFQVRELDVSNSSKRDKNADLSINLDKVTKTK